MVNFYRSKYHHKSMMIFVIIVSIGAKSAIADGFSFPLLSKNPQENCSCSVKETEKDAIKANHSIFFLGAEKRFDPNTSKRNSDLNYFAYAHNTEYQAWNFETGAGTFVDGYDKRSYLVFSNITNDQLRTHYVQPALSLSCAYKA